jgi:methyltransferase (TIGR00027 family)
VALSLYWVQLRTRLIDEQLLAFVAAGGRQLVLLGAGYDVRAERLRDRLGGVRVLEVDHPATQRRKRRVLGAAGQSGGDARYLSWDFERDPMPALPRRLAAMGHDPAQPTFTVWEGVSMYLAEDVIAATVSAIRAWSAPGSRLAFDYFHRASLGHRGLVERWVVQLVTRRHEPFRFGWEPSELPRWLAAHRFALERDDGDADIANRLLSREHARVFLGARDRWEFRLAIAAPSPEPEAEPERAEAGRGSSPADREEAARSHLRRRARRRVR